jgi:hypothetical protein
MLLLAGSVHTMQTPFLSSITSGEPSSSRSIVICSVSSFHDRFSGRHTCQGDGEQPICRFFSFRIQARSAAFGQQTINVGALTRAWIDNERWRLAGTLVNGSDGTRTRDLRRDRPLQESRLLTTINAQSLDACGLAASSAQSRILPRGCFRTFAARLLPESSAPGIEVARLPLLGRLLSAV